MSCSDPIGARELGDGVGEGRDRDGFGLVFRAQQDAALRLAFLLCGDRDRSEDAVAEAFAKMWPHWRRGSVRDDRAYLRRAVVNELRSRARRGVLEDRETERRTALGRGDPTAEDSSTERQALLTALGTLPARQRAVIVLRFYEDLTEAASADALGMRIGTVKSQTSRALGRLRGVLSREEPG